MFSHFAKFGAKSIYFSVFAPLTGILPSKLSVPIFDRIPAWVDSRPGFDTALAYSKIMVLPEVALGIGILVDSLHNTSPLEATLGLALLYDATFGKFGFQEPEKEGPVGWFEPIFQSIFNYQQPERLEKKPSYEAKDLRTLL